ncbi:hypothetical protein ACLOJK_011037 [Asimina triloba]
MAIYDDSGSVLYTHRCTQRKLALPSWTDTGLFGDSKFGTRMRNILNFLLLSALPSLKFHSNYTTIQPITPGFCCKFDPGSRRKAD